MCSRTLQRYARPGCPDRKRIDVLIGQSDKQLLTVLKEREGASPEEPNYVLTRFELIASAGQVPDVISGSLSGLRVQVDSYEHAGLECAHKVSLKHFNRILQDLLTVIVGRLDFSCF